jgi:hypothetical protein
MHGHISRRVLDICDVDTSTGLDTVPDPPLLSTVWGKPEGGPAGTRDPDRFRAGLRGVGTGPAFETRG